MADDYRGDYRKEFPDFGELDIELPEGFVDRSWHNDAMPCFLNKELGLELWVDYADPELSELGREKETGRYPRFIVADLDGNTLASCETWAGAKRFIDIRAGRA